MSSVVILIGGFACLIAGYIFYGSWLSRQWGVDENRPTPAITMQDGVKIPMDDVLSIDGKLFSSLE